MSRQLISSPTVRLIIATMLIINVGVSQAMLPPPMLRAVCSAFADAEEVVGAGALAAGKAAVDMALKPIAIVGGLQAAAVGTGMKIGGGAMKFVGQKIAKDGAFFEATGAGVKGAGLGVAALGLKPAAEKIVAAGKVAEGTLGSAKTAAENLVKSVGDTSVQLEATIDSPVVGHHHKQVNMSAGLDTALHHPLLQPGQHIEQEQQHVVAKRAVKLDPEVVKSAINLVKEAKLEDCVARAICDLNCNPQGFGQDGKHVFMNMVRLQGSSALDSTDSKFFREAASKGRTYSGKCDSCTTQYEKCQSKSSDLIRLASHINMEGASSS